MDEKEWREFPTDMKMSNYKISNDGEIWSRHRSKILLQHLNNFGYYILSLVNDDGVKKSFFVHRLLSKVFTENPENKPTVDHIDRKRSNNELSNLRWATIKEQHDNQIHGKTDNSRKISQYDLNGNLIKHWNSIRDAAKSLGITYRIDMSGLKKHGLSKEYIWEYAFIENLPNEIWKEIKKLPTYHASNKGRIKHVISNNNERLLCGTNHGGYLVVDINNKNRKIHNLVCRTFKKKKPNINYVANHLDGNPLNNDINNLVWATRSENSKHAHEMGLIDKSRMYRSVTKFDLNGKFLAEYISITSASDLNDITHTLISAACREISKTAGGFKWKYTNEIKSLDEVENSLSLIKNNSWKSVSQYSLDGKFIDTFPSLAQASFSTDIHKTAICRACTGKSKTSGGFIWKYSDKIESV